VPDYVTRCDAGNPVQVAVDAPPGRAVAVDGAAAETGSFTRMVALAPGQSFSFASISTTKTTTYHVRCLPADFPQWSVDRSGPTQAQWFLTANFAAQYAIVFDGRGVPVWWFGAGHPVVDFKLLPNGHFSWWQRSFEPGSVAGYLEHDLAGAPGPLMRTVTDRTDLHDQVLLPDGHYLMISYPIREHVDLSPYGGPADARVEDSEVEELAPDGTLLWSWNTRDHVGLDETSRWWPSVVSDPADAPDGSGKVYDIAHMNAVEPHGDELVVSLRHTDAVYAIDRESGAIRWKLGGTPTPESLSIENDPLAARDFGGQHDPRFLPDGTLTLFDNGTERDRAPRALRYRIDEVTHTAHLAEQVSDPSAPSSFCCGSARKLSAGDWVVDWGSRPQFGEYTPAGDNVLRVTFAESFPYRAAPLEQGVLSADALRAGMDLMFPRP
jgi:hypothetical protein